MSDWHLDTRTLWEYMQTCKLPILVIEPEDRLLISILETRG